MIEDRAHSGTFRDVASEFITSGFSFRFQARGRSMWPTIRDGDILHVEGVASAAIRLADVVLFSSEQGLKAHRVVRKHAGTFVTRGDAAVEADSPIRGEQIMGRVVAKECAETRRVTSLRGFVPRMRYFTSQACGAFSRRIARRFL